MDIVRKYADDGFLKISWYNEKTDLLGPFFRFVLWVQGCDRKCPGCIAENMQDPSGGKAVKISELAEIIASGTGTEGMTVSGGEPFYQADRICGLIDAVHRLRPDFGVIVYTGFTYGELADSDEYSVRRLLEMTDILIDGAYIEELDDNKGLRGSSNQNVIFLTDRYNGYRDMYMNPQGRRNSISISDTGLQMTGVPSENTKELISLLTQ